MEHYEEVLKILHNQFDWTLTDSLTTTGKKLVADTIKALKIAENNQTLQLLQTDVIKSVCPKCDSEDLDGIGQYRRCNKCNERWKQTVL